MASRQRAFPPKRRHRQEEARIGVETTMKYGVKADGLSPKLCQAQPESVDQLLGWYGLDDPVDEEMGDLEEEKVDALMAASLREGGGLATSSGWMATEEAAGQDSSADDLFSDRGEGSDDCDSQEAVERYLAN